MFIPSNVRLRLLCISEFIAMVISVKVKDFKVRKEGGRVLIRKADNRNLLSISEQLHSELVELRTHGKLRKEQYEIRKKVWDVLHNLGFVEIDTYIENTIDSLRSNPLGRFSLNSRIAPISILWAISSQCNLSCIYCYPDLRKDTSCTPQLSFEKVMLIAENIVTSGVLFVTLSGGEIMMRRDIWQVIDYLQSNLVEVSLISNGTLINRNIAKEIARRDLNIAVSLDASLAQTHDLLRGQNTHQRAVRGIRYLLEEKCKLNLACAVTKNNIDDVDELASFANSLGVDGIVLQELRPFGGPEQFDFYRPSVEQENHLFAVTLPKLRRKYPNMYFNSTELGAFCHSKLSKRDRNKMECGAGERQAYISAEGDIYPCSNLVYPELKLGNAIDSSFLNIWRQNERLKAFVDFCNRPVKELPHCLECEKNSQCNGGCRGEALFYSGDITGRAARCSEVR